ncbi:Adenylosuccinate synthase [Cytospora paraplurivora]|uniref:Adenylosuccinate synthetase n=1 Tax=Cytospora paraplurivora TaxID=2898453 RepID=A0AAN9UK99_9PEZI
MVQEAKSDSRTGGKTYAFHLLPSGLINPKVDNLIGSGVVFNVEAFYKELADLESKGVPRVHERIHVSSRCHLNLTLHSAVDGLAEAELGTGKIGTTKRGIGPTYATKASRDGLRIIDIYHESFERKLRVLADGYRKRYGDLLEYDVEEELERFKGYKEKLRPYIVDAVEYMREVREKKLTVLVEGSQALMLDLDFGSYPFVTSSFCSTGGCIQGLSLSPFEIKNIIGVVKAYTTRVGGGPFPTEQLGDVGTTLQEVGGEITIRVGVAYITADGQRLTSFPADLSLLENCTVEYVDLPGWQSSTKGVRTWEGLPPQAQKYIEWIESAAGVKCTYIGTGQDRDEMVIRT